MLYATNPLWVLIFVIHIILALYLAYLPSIPYPFNSFQYTDGRWISVKHWLGYIKAHQWLPSILTHSESSKVSSNCIDLISSPCIPLHTLYISVQAESFQIRLSLQSFAYIFPPFK